MPTERLWQLLEPVGQTLFAWKDLCSPTWETKAGQTPAQESYCAIAEPSVPTTSPSGPTSTKNTGRSVRGRGSSFSEGRGGETFQL